MEYGQSQDLKNWTDGWRFPDLWCRIIKGEEPDSYAVLQGLLRGYAEPVVPSELCEELLRSGEFDAVASLLDNQKFRAKLPEKDRASLEREIKQRQSDHQNETGVTEY